MQRIHSWLHAGEHDVVAVYVLGYPSVTILFFIGLSLYTRSLFPGDPLGMIIAAMLLSFALLSFRRALILGSSAIAYRPMLGKPKPIAYANITSMKRQRVLGTFAAVPGIRFDLKDRRLAAVPVDCSKAFEVYSRLTSLTGMPLK